MSLYAQLDFLGEPVTFVSEKQLAEGRAPKVQWIVLPQATHVTDGTVSALAKFVRAGGHLLQEGDHNLESDQYHRQRTLPAEIADCAKLTPAPSESENAEHMRGLLQKGDVKMNELTDATTGKRAWGVEFRVAKTGGKNLVSLINLGTAACSVRVPVLKGQAADLLSDEAVETTNVHLEPMVPRLLVQR